MSLMCFCNQAEARKEALRRNPDYVKYIQNLSTANYFKGEREGSQLWSTLEDKAAALFVEVRREEYAKFSCDACIDSRLHLSDTSRQSFASLVTASVSQATNNLESSAMENEDSDEWLNIDAENLESLLENTMGSRKGATQKDPDSGAMDIAQDYEQETAEDRIANEQAAKLRKLAEKVEEFVEGEGDLEGARFKE
jgi:hypothetical protein